MAETGSPAASWVPRADGSGFGVEHLPYGVIRGPNSNPRTAVRIGDQARCRRSNTTDATWPPASSQPSLVNNDAETASSPAGPTANPALGLYVRDPGGRIFTELLVLTLSGNRVCAIRLFDSSVLPHFGLPRQLPGWPCRPVRRGRVGAGKLGNTVPDAGSLTTSMAVSPSALQALELPIRY